MPAVAIPLPLLIILVLASLTGAWLAWTSWRRSCAATAAAAAAATAAAAQKAAPPAEAGRTHLVSIEGSSQALAMASADLLASAESADEQAQHIAAAATQVSGTTTATAHSIEQMAQAVREIAGTTSEASQVSSEAEGRAQEADRAVKHLQQSSGGIGDVVQTITAIAEQTNLLALNAAIEAASAGEAGRGFAVVASEVKNLARQTAEATSDVQKRIAAIQQDTAAAMTAIAEINRLIRRNHELQQTVAAAVEEQSATTTDIARSIGEAARGTGEIASGIGQLAKATRGTSTGAITVKDLGAQLGEHTEALHQALVGSAAGQGLEQARAAVEATEAGFFERVVRSHIGWRTRLLDALTPGSALPERSQAADPGACDLGRWLHAEAARLSCHPGYQPLVEAHRQYHGEIGRIIDLIAAHRTDEARNELFHGEFHRLAITVVGLLGRLRTESTGTSTRKAEGMLVWSQRFATGHARIDQQHQELFRRTNELHAAMVEGRGRRVIGEMIRFLAEYTVNHFAEEERAMTQAAYAGKAGHLEQHQRLLKQVGDLLARFEQGAELRTMEVTEFLAGWLRHHITDEDFAYVPSLRKAGLITA
jgi:hemerythrin-like metal-binding protein